MDVSEVFHTSVCDLPMALDPDLDPVHVRIMEMMHESGGN